MFARRSGANVDWVCERQQETNVGRNIRTSVQPAYRENAFGKRILNPKLKDKEPFTLAQTTNRQNRGLRVSRPGPVQHWRRGQPACEVGSVDLRNAPAVALMEAAAAAARCCSTTCSRDWFAVPSRADRGT